MLCFFYNCPPKDVMSLECVHNYKASVLESECLSASIEEIETLKNKAEEVEEYLDGQCVYLVGQFTDVSHANPRFIHFWYPNFGRNTGIFLFRLTEVLQKLSLMHRLIAQGTKSRPLLHEESGGDAVGISCFDLYVLPVDTSFVFEAANYFNGQEG
ncbi:hypothetical protein T459_31280 [Capsicum annuum]|uniref:Uncharacterized protein n=1 Tax=Capsicum annuum TaxID=4072 RepID=A0A2G2YAS4_CAPAN|nr:hypothetical protein T459_31280 [Capsicum annuum]